MDESDRTTARKNIVVFTNYTDLSPEKRIAPQNRTYEFMNSLRAGAVQTGMLISPESSYVLQFVIIQAVESILAYCASNNLGPTKTSRYFYMWFMSIVGAYNWVYESRRIKGVTDGWNWDMHTPLSNYDDITCWMTEALAVIMLRFNPDYDVPALLAYERAHRGWSPAEQAANIQQIKADANWDAWYSAWNTWMSARSADGSVVAAVPPPVEELPNGGTYLNTADYAQDPSSFSAPTKWTPLQIGLKFQKYLTYNWQEVRSSCLKSADETAIAAAAAAKFPTDSERVAEIEEIIATTNTLSDTEKVQAEFWAGGPGTPSPPGMFIWFWKTYAAATNLGKRDINAFFFSGLDLAVNLFEAGRLVWGLKKTYMQARPIQEIRRLYRNTPMKKYDGTDIIGAEWMPYQELDFVSPPFADFPSGHSAFSRSFANVMETWFGPNIPTDLSIEIKDIYILSPHLTNQTTNYGTFVWNAGRSGIQNGVVPASDITLSWNTWASMAESAGYSRFYGGIHARSAHTGSVAASDALHNFIKTRMAIDSRSS